LGIAIWEMQTLIGLNKCFQKAQVVQDCNGKGVENKGNSTSYLEKKVIGAEKLKPHYGIITRFPVIDCQDYL
jgi:hypothetical protein